MLMPRPTRVAFLLAITIALAACGGDEAGSSGPVTELEVRMDSFFYDPAVSTVLADADIELTARNLDGALPHNWAIIEQGSEIGAESDIVEEIILYDVGEVSPQGTGIGTFRLPVGEYQVVCTVPGHFSAGMKGIVNAATGS